MSAKVSGVVWAVALLASAALADGASASTRVYMKPVIGKPTTHFVMRFRAPVRTGVVSNVRSHFQVSASGPKRNGCVSSVSIALRPAKRHAHVRVTLKPKAHGGAWCAGKYRGRIAEIQTIVCRPATGCSGVVIAPRTIARFSFRVRKGQPGTGTGSPGSGPTFAGLQSATTCPTVTKKVAPKSRTYSLKWSPATDPVTPSSKIVYDIYYSATSGGENYSTPSWKTLPGATSYTVQISGFGAAYFVVRARDQAGHEDHNTVERVGVVASMC